MAIDWGFAGQIGGVGFGTVFIVLLLLAAAVWIVGLVTRKMASPEDDTNAKKKGA